MRPEVAPAPDATAMPGRRPESEPAPENRFFAARQGPLPYTSIQVPSLGNVVLSVEIGRRLSPTKS